MHEATLEESSVQGCGCEPQRLLGLPTGWQGGLGRSGGHRRCVTPIWPGCIRNGQARHYFIAKIQMVFPTSTGFLSLFAKISMLLSFYLGRRKTNPLFFKAERRHNYL